MRTSWPGFEPVELAGEWPPGAPRGIFHATGTLDGVVIDHADPRIVISAQLIDHIVEHPHPNCFVDLAGCDTYMGALLKLRGLNRTVIYRLTEWLPIHAYVGEFV